MGGCSLIQQGLILAISTHMIKVLTNLADPATWLFQVLSQVKPFPSQLKTNIVSREVYDSQLSHNVNAAWRETRENLAERLQMPANQVSRWLVIS